MQELTDRLIDGFAARGEADLIHEFAFPLPIYAICDLLGVPREDQDDFRDWAGMMIRHGKGPRGGVARSVKKMRGYLAELIHRKREALPAEAAPGEDLVSGLIRASDEGEHLTENEVAAMAFILLFAGFETTVNLIGNGTHALLTHPEQRARLQDSLAAGDMGLLETGVEELLRFDGPVELATWRFATRPLTLGGQDIAPGRPSSSSWRPPTATRSGSPNPTCSISRGVTINTSATGTASTTVSVRRSPGWRAGPRSRRS